MGFFTLGNEKWMRKKNFTKDVKNVRKMETFSVSSRLKGKNTHITESHLAKCHQYAIAKI